MGMSLAAEKPAKAASKDSWRLGKKKEGKGKRRKTPFCKDAERTEVALKEEMNGRMSDNGAESPKWKGEKEVTAMEKHSPTQQPAMPRHRTLSLQDKPTLHPGFAGILPKMDLPLLGPIKPGGRLRVTGPNAVG